MNDASIGLMTVALLVAFFALGWILLKLCDLMVVMGKVLARWRAECEEPLDVDLGPTPWPFPIPEPPPQRTVKAGRCQCAVCVADRLERDA